VPNQKCTFGQFHAVELGAEQTGHHPVHHTEGHEAVPADATDVHVRHDPIREVRDGVDELHAQQGPSKVAMP
jgi:hypothetical protein